MTGSMTLRAALIRMAPRWAGLKAASKAVMKVLSLRRALHLAG